MFLMYHFGTGRGYSASMNSMQAPPDTNHFVGEVYGEGIVVSIERSVLWTKILILGPEDLKGTYEWGNVSVMNDYASIMDMGAWSTKEIIEAGASANTAAVVCANYRGGGYDDCFLPTCHELRSYYTQLPY